MTTVLEQIPGSRPPWTAGMMRAANYLAPAARHAWLNTQFSPPVGLQLTHAMLCPVVNQLITHRDVLLRTCPQLRALTLTPMDWRSTAATEGLIHLYTGAFDCRGALQKIEGWVGDAWRPGFPPPLLGTLIKSVPALPVQDVLTGAVCDH
ncbi:uncharacterized protein N7483_001440 [Penicillium malachiteum]|uniref:uncharacterized protein n=1 Tax=Penicillium malachiteum TaxID=1324776 RepID=UPI0025481B0E|nr:uncharacterized protein N7483_001440 [Penicillium malachiteum]KAJ5736315.1 hypothetical protein N7483_001440 [Penicillium malachiteum]